MRILIDLSILKNVHCGLGQVALNYGYYFRDHYQPVPGEQIYLLVPKEYFGAFSQKVQYIESKKIYRLFPWLIGKRFDVWHAIYQLSRYTPYARHTVLTIHDFNFEYEKQGRKAQRYLREIQRKADRADMICAISQFTKSEIEKFLHLHNKPIEVIYNGVERIDTRSQQAMDEIKQPYLFSIGEVKPKKNFHVLLDMMRYLPQYQLYIAGKNDTPYANSIQSEIQQKGMTNVHLLGLINEPQKTWLYAHSTAFVFPSLFEGFGLPVIEAMLFHKPIICSQETSLVEIGNQYTTFFTKGYPARENAERIQSAIDAYQSDKQLAEKAFDYACEFNWVNHMESYLRFYRAFGQ